jgi:nitroimidazol reductase NimA-like FMN-containing flavoprotein (pyridoxamine 5'-phosphate oxidase superfamily)
MTVEPDVHVSTRQLDHQAIEALLAKHHVGSTAIAFHDRMNIALANYVYTDRRIYGRLEDGPDVATVRHHHWVAFQVSEIDGIYDWRTVTANGSIPGLTDGPPWVRQRNTERRWI